MTTRIVDLDTKDADSCEQAAHLLHRGFRELTPAWPTVESARSEVTESLAPGRISRVMLDAAGRVVGWIGAQPHYDGHVWEIHPLVVSEAERGQGVGRALVLDVEALVSVRGALTLWVGTDDERDATTLSGVDLYEDTLAAIAGVRNLARHPYEFYQRLGFQIVGVLPDANGPGKPDIFLAKRVAGDGAARRG